MKIAIFSVLAFIALALAVVPPQKAVIISYPDNTPDKIVDQAMDAIKAAGGMITHEYKLIKGFAAKAPAKVLDTVQTWGNDYHAVIEEDQMVSVVGSGRS